MSIQEILTDPRRDFLSPVERDLRIIRRDIVAVLQETADVRATMNDISSYRRGASKRFVVLAGLVCFVILVLLVVCQPQLQAWLRLM